MASYSRRHVRGGFNESASQDRYLQRRHRRQLRPQGRSARLHLLHRQSASDQERRRRWKRFRSRFCLCRVNRQIGIAEKRLIFGKNLY